MGMRFTEEEFNQLQARQEKSKSPKKPTSKDKLQALGRLKTGEMNKTEHRFAERLKLQEHAGEVLWWKFEAIKLIIAPNTSITVDFAVLPTSGILTMIDVKGSKAIVTDDFKAKVKVAASMFPFVFQVAYPKPKGEGWIIEEI